MVTKCSICDQKWAQLSATELLCWIPFFFLENVTKIMGFLYILFNENDFLWVQWEGYKIYGVCLWKKPRDTHGTPNSDTTDHLTLTNNMSWHYYLCPFFWGFYEHTSDFWILTFWAGGLARGCASLSNTEQPSAQPARDLAVSSPEDSLFPSCWLAALWRQIGFRVNSAPSKVTNRAGMAHRAAIGWS